MRVALDARIPDGRWGGVQQVVQGLAHGLRELDGPDEFLFLVEPGSEVWLGPMVGGSTRIIEVPTGSNRTRLQRVYEAVDRRLPALARLGRAALATAPASAMPIPTSDGFVESLGVDAIHFTVPQAFLTSLSSIYQPHDLLHRHHPEQLGRLHASYREAAYRRFCAEAAIVIAMTECGRADLVAAYDLPVDRVAVVPWAPVAGLVAGVGAAPRLPDDLPERFVLYPAQTWPHKNHAGLLEALALLRDRGTRVDLVSIGRLNDGFPAIERRVAELALQDQVRFLGYVGGPTVNALYERAAAVVFPSRFEGWGLPIVEAFASGVPVAASNASVIPEVAGGAALLFDPERPEDIADAILRVWTDGGLRDELRQRGRERVAMLSWTKTAATFVALYRLVAGRSLTAADRAMLAPPTLVGPIQ